MRCIICLKSEPKGGFSEEHIFPESLGGNLTTRQVCKPCNDYLGHSVDAPLINHTFIAIARMNLGLAGKTGQVPNPLELATLEGQPDQKVRFPIDPRKPGPHKIYTYPRVQRTEQNGEAVIQFNIDVDDDKRFGTIINTALRRAGVAQLPPAEIEQLKKSVVHTENPRLHVKLDLDIHDYRRGIIKIAYELACMWLGDGYLDDPTATVLRDCMRDKGMPSDISSKYPIRGDIRFACGEPLILFWKEEKNSLIGVCLHQADFIGVYVRIFGVFDGLICVTEQPELYPDFKNRFVLIDAPSGQRRISTFEVEVKRIVDRGETF